MFVQRPQLSTTEHAIVLAAGRGSRLNPEEGYKLLVEIDGEPMLDRHLANFRRLGVREVTIVVGYRPRPLAEAIREWETPEEVDVQVAVNPAFDAGNGLSVLAGIDQARRGTGVGRPAPFWLTMSDHLFEPAVVGELVDRVELDAPSGEAESIAHADGGGAALEGMLVVDSKIETIYDLDDANKVRTGADGSLEAIGKELAEFDVIDAGLFWCSEEFVGALDEERRERGDCSTSDAVRALAERGAFGLFDLGEARWQDVDTPGAREYAEKLIRRE